jgi:hypothetical protein
LFCLVPCLFDCVLIEHLLRIGRFRNRNCSTILHLVTNIVSVYRSDVVYDLFPGHTHLVCCPLLTIIEDMVPEGGA